MDRNSFRRIDVVLGFIDRRLFDLLWIESHQRNFLILRFMFLIAWPFFTFIFWYVFFNYFHSSAFNGKEPYSDRKIFMMSLIVGGLVAFVLIGF